MASIVGASDSMRVLVRLDRQEPFASSLGKFGRMSSTDPLTLPTRWCSSGALCELSQQRSEVTCCRPRYRHATVASTG